jgi:hypothetical protein
MSQNLQTNWSFVVSWGMVTNGIKSKIFFSKNNFVGKVELKA